MQLSVPIWQDCMGGGGGGGFGGRGRGRGGGGWGRVLGSRGVLVLGLLVGVSYQIFPLVVAGLLSGWFPRLVFWSAGGRCIMGFL